MQDTNHALQHISLGFLRLDQVERFIRILEIMQTTNTSTCILSINC